MDDEVSKRKKLAETLRGRYVRFQHESKFARGHLVVDMTDDGMVILQGFAGEFAPHLFEVVTFD